MPKSTIIQAQVPVCVNRIGMISKAKREKLKLRSRQAYIAELSAATGQRKADAIRRRIEKLQAQLAAEEKSSECNRVSRETETVPA